MEAVTPYFDGSSSSHGGHRKGSGRKPLIETPECLRIVNMTRETAERQDLVKMRMHYAVKRQNPQFAEAHDELNVEYGKLRSATFAQQQGWIADDAGSPIEEIREIRNLPGFAQLIHVPQPNQFVMSISTKL